MAQANVETVRTALRALDQRDVELYLSIASPEIELITPTAALEGANVGHEGVRRFFKEIEESVESSRVEVEEVRAVGERVIAFFRVRGVGRISGAETSMDVAGVYSVEDGKVRRAEIFADREAALQAVRRSE
jgi:ketosteroid isomerase-like protein